METTVSANLMEQLVQGMVKEGVLTPDQVAVAKVRQEDLGEDLGQVLVRKGFISEAQFLRHLAKYLSIPYVSLKKCPIDTQVANELPYHLAKRHHLVPLRREGIEVVVAMSDPLNLQAIEDLRHSLHAEVRPVLASSDEIEEVLHRIYHARSSGKEISLEPSMRRISSEDDYVHPDEEKKIEEIAVGSRVVQVVNELIVGAYTERASDIHIEPHRKDLIVRYRIDGLLEEKARYAREMHLPIVSRIKIISGLDIAERRSPQDGRVRIKVGGKPIDLRVSTYPTIHGEKVVLRLLATSEKIGIEELGFSEQERKLFSELIGRPHGIFLVTGPTGSGKSTTLYAALERLNSPEKNIVSIEDPVEREITGISQAQINIKAGITFASALRAILRQDPDIIMLGEIRDRETAEIAVRAAITGHLVLTTLHTNTAAGAISRLNDLGVESFLLSSSLVGVLAQRLVRKICLSCRKEVPSSDEGPSHLLKRKIEKMFRGKGCPECHLSGYSGRVGIFELVPVRGKILQLIADGAKEDQIEKEIRSTGIRSMLDDGIEKVVKGVTTIDEILRAVQED